MATPKEIAPPLMIEAVTRAELVVGLADRPMTGVPPARGGHREIAAAGTAGKWRSSSPVDLLQGDREIGQPQRKTLPQSLELSPRGRDQCGKILGPVLVEQRPRAGRAGPQGSKAHLR